MTTAGAAQPCGLIPPELDVDSAPWWEALDREELRAQHCNRCGEVFAPAMPTSSQCGARDLCWRTISGRGRAYSWVTGHVAMDLAFEADVRYSVVVEMEAASRTFGRRLDTVCAQDLPVTADVCRVDGQAPLGFRADGRKGWC